MESLHPFAVTSQGSRIVRRTAFPGRHEIAELGASEGMTAWEGRPTEGRYELGCYSVMRPREGLLHPLEKSREAGSNIADIASLCTGQLYMPVKCEHTVLG